MEGAYGNRWCLWGQNPSTQIAWMGDPRGSLAITKRGIPVAVVQPIDPAKKIDTGSITAELRRFREKNKLSGLSIREMIEEGRR